MTRRSLGKAFLLSLFIAALVAFIALRGPQYLSLEALKANRDTLVAFADANRAAAVALTFAVYAGAVAMSLPGGAVFALTCGLLFGRILGTAVAVLAATLGATLVFLATRYLFADIAARRLGVRGQHIRDGFTRHAFSYLLFLRVVPLFPFFLVNLAPAFTSIRVSTYIVATLIGVIPATFVYVTLGQALGNVDSLRSALSFQTLGALAVLGLLALIPVFMHRRERGTVARVRRP